MYLKDALLTVNSLADTRLYVSVADINSEKKDLKAIRKKIDTLTALINDLKQKPSLEDQEVIQLLTEEVKRYKRNVEATKKNSEYNLSKLNELLDVEQYLTSQIIGVHRKITLQKLAVSKATVNLLKEKFVPDPIPRRILNMPYKTMRKALIKHRLEQDRKEKIWQQKASDKIAELKSEVTKTERLLYPLYVQLRPVTTEIEHLRYSTDLNNAQIREYKRLIRNLQAKIRRRQLKQALPDLFDLKITQLIEQILDATIKRKVKSALQRIQLNFYVIIKEKKDAEYTRKLDRNGKKGTVKVNYPKGKFQVIMNCDSFTEPNTDTVLVKIEPLLSLTPLMSEIACEKINEQFNIIYGFKPGKLNVNSAQTGDLTIGVTNANLGAEDLGTPPELVSIARSTNDMNGEGFKRDSRFSNLNNKDWSNTIDTSIMTQSEYNQFIVDMKDYVTELKRLGKYRTGMEEY